MRPSPLYLCKKERSINLLDYVENADTLPETVSFSVDVNYSEDIATAEMDEHLLTVTAVSAGETQIWLGIYNDGWRTDSILLEMDIVDDPTKCNDENNGEGTDEEGDDDDDDEDTQQCQWVKVARIWIRICK